MKKMKMSKFARIIYAIVGVTGVLSLTWAVLYSAEFTNMGFWGIVGFSIAIVGSINWGIVAITGNRRKDLFGMLGF